MKQKMCHCHVLMTKYISKTMDMMDQFVVVRVNYKKHTQKTKQQQQQQQQQKTTTILIITYKSFLIKDILLFFYQKSFFFCQSIKALSDLWLRISNLKNAKHLKDN